jgi:hypothetical protein
MAVQKTMTVEVDFPSSFKSQKALRIKVSNYLAAGATVWIFRPEFKKVEVHTPSQPYREVGIAGVLDGGNILPGFKLRVRDVFGE